jgi:hypothetical protein
MNSGQKSKEPTIHKSRRKSKKKNNSLRTLKKSKRKRRIRIIWRRK